MSLVHTRVLLVSLLNPLACSLSVYVLHDKYGVCMARVTRRIGIGLNSVILGESITIPDNRQCELNGQMSFAPSM
ncbi:uncharacterized protein GGS25DRAFT_497589 [Hypoxylon fragiforme]|uniref:uncharacterized protein n=1 Tax=Hypoxylon fragiforme TaxID=63214 RepID=UPI0020C5E881|nr:uncharacterized protein GGS25DRAFT_497589 [Hypoxylon fragiforme]KAI2605692.1 hypothetical protein GGS25DRAFT_497589 [Hypoxylon fragiforme]